jgi:hypothetical protein
MLTIELDNGGRKTSITDFDMGELTSWPEVTKLFFNALQATGYIINFDADEAVELLSSLNKTSLE